MKNKTFNQQFLLISLITVIMSFYSCGDYLIPPDPKAENPAQEALSLIESLANEHTHKHMGFASLEEVSSAKLGLPISVFTISHDVINTYQVNMNPMLILTDRHEIIYPVLAGEQIRSSIGIMYDGKVWEFVDMGRPNFTNALFEARQLRMASHGKKHTEFFLVNFPSLYVTLLCHGEGENTYQMALIHGDESIGLNVNQFLPGNEVFAKVAAFAKDNSVGGLDSN